MPFRAIAYVSEASRSLTEERLQRLVAEAVQFNESVDVTGTLLFDGSRFLQYLEGPEAGINAAYTRILAAGSHSGIVELNRGRVGRRQFPHWRMRSVRVDELALGRSPSPTGLASCAARRRWSRAPAHWIVCCRSRTCRRMQVRERPWNRTGSWYDDGGGRPACIRSTACRLCGLVAAARGSGSVRRGRQRAAALRHTPADGGDQLILLSAAPGQDLCAMGGERAGGLPVRGETAARDQP